MRVGDAHPPRRTYRWVVRAVLALGLVVLLMSGCTDTHASRPHIAGSKVGTRVGTRPAPAVLRKAAHHRHPAVTARSVEKRHRAPGVPRVDVPDPRLTPGVVLTANAGKVCSPGYSASVRDVPTSEADAVYARYHVAHVSYAHEVDHLVSLELGGSNAIGNLWPEPYAGRWGARTKDVLENRLHDLVCAGVLSLPVAQHLEATDWVAAYRRFEGRPPTVPVVHRRPTAPRTTTRGSCEPGYSPCLPVTSDLDCADIPDGKKPVRVTGADPYRLDADGDGFGCE